MRAVFQVVHDINAAGADCKDAGRMMYGFRHDSVNILNASVGRLASRGGGRDLQTAFQNIHRQKLKKDRLSEVVTNTLLPWVCIASHRGWGQSR